MRKRWKWLSIVSALVTVAAGGVYAAALPAAAATGPEILPVQFTNQTGRGDAVYLYVIGTDLSTGGLGYVNAGGTFTDWPAGANPPVPAPDVSIGGPATAA